MNTINNLKLRVQTAVIQWYRMDDAGDGVESLVQTEFWGEAPKRTLSEWIEEQLTECKSLSSSNFERGWITEASAKHYENRFREMIGPDYNIWTVLKNGRWFVLSDCTLPTGPRKK